MRHVLTWFYGWAGRAYGWFHDEQRGQAVQARHGSQANLGGIQRGTSSSVSHDRDGEG